MSLTAFSRPLAIAAATLREGLRDRAAAKLGEPVTAVLDDVGGFQTADLRKVSYADLVDDAGLVIEREADQSVPELYAFNSSRQKTQVGHSKSPLGIRDMVTGARVYTADVPMEGVLYGRAVQPLARNARIASLDTSGVAEVQGVVTLVEEGDFVGVVCTTPSAVDKAMAQIHVTWDLQQPINEEIRRLVDVDAKMAAGDLEHILQDKAHRPNVDWSIDLRFDVQVQTHAAQEPRAAIARFNEAGAEHRLEI